MSNGAVERLRKIAEGLKLGGTAKFHVDLSGSRFFVEARVLSKIYDADGKLFRLNIDFDPNHVVFLERFHIDWISAGVWLGKKDKVIGIEITS
jgi:hypothetical protein